MIRMPSARCSTPCTTRASTSTPTRHRARAPWVHGSLWLAREAITPSLALYSHTTIPFFLQLQLRCILFRYLQLLSLANASAAAAEEAEPEGPYIMKLDQKDVTDMKYMKLRALIKATTCPHHGALFADVQASSQQWIRPPFTLYYVLVSLGIRQ